MPVAELSGRRSALIVATDEYADQRLRKLRSPARDVRDLERVLGDPAIGAFAVEVVRNAPEYQVRRRIDEFFRRGEPGDVLFLHLSCHGLKDDYGHLHFATADTELDSLDSTAVASDWLRRQIDRSPSRRVVVQLDCCYSGAFTSAATHRASSTTLDVPGYLAGERPHGRGCVILTASSAIEYAFEGDRRSGQGEASVFTGAVVKGLEDGAADLDGDGQVSVAELYDYVFQEVRATTARQTPGMRADVQGDIFIARSPHGPRPERAAAPALPPDVVAGIESPHAAARAGAVTHLATLRSGPNQALATTAHQALTRLVDDDSPVVSAAAYAALGGRRYTWVRATGAMWIALALVALGVVLMVVANASPMYFNDAGTLSGSMFAYQTLGVAAAAAAVAIAFLANRASAQLTAGFLFGAALASGLGVYLAMIDVGENTAVPFSQGSSLFMLQRYDPLRAWVLATVCFLGAGLILATLAFGLRAAPRARSNARSVTADLAILAGGAAGVAGTLLAAEAFVLYRYNVRFGVGERHGFQPLVLACAVILLVAVKRVLPRDLDAVIYGVLIALGVVLELYFAGILLVLHSPNDASAGIPLGIAAAVAVIVGAITGAGPWRRAREPSPAS